MRVRLLLLLLLLACCAAAPAGAQDAPRPAPFSTLDVHGGVTADVLDGLLFDAYWTPAPGAAGGVSTPFHLGTAEVGGAVHRYAATLDSLPDFTALLAYAGWGVGTHAGRLGLHGGVRAGVYRMTFDEDTFAGVRNESELVLGVVGRADFRLAGGWALYGEAAYLKTYTYIRLQQVWVTAGLRVRLRTPGALRRFLE